MKITKEELARLYHENSLAVASKRLGVCVNTLLSYVDKAGIPRKGKNATKVTVIY